MIALLLLGLVAGACAAPQYNFDFMPQRRSFFPDYQIRDQALGDSLFDTRRFWADLSKELKELDDMLADFSHRFPTSVSTAGIQGNEYKITISLPDFEEKDIVVKAREGLVMIQANHKFAPGSEKNYLDLRTLPDCVNVTGNWVFEQGILKITFPLKAGANVPETVTPTTEQLQTIRPNFDVSREEMAPAGDKTEGPQDADVGLGIGDTEKETELKTNEVPNSNTVEATTYAVDLKDEVEFVPVRY